MAAQGSHLAYKWIRYDLLYAPFFGCLLVCSSTLQNYIDAGVTGVTASNLAEVNSKIASAISASSDSTAEIQSVVGSGVTNSSTTTTLGEATTGTYTVVLNTQPTGNVTITPASGDTGAATVSGVMTFTTANWNSAQTVTVTGVADDDTANESVIITHTVAGADYASVNSANVTATVTDNTLPTVAFNATTSAATEAVGNQTITIDLSDASGQAVTVNYASTGTATGSGTDYTLVAGTATIAAGATSTTVTLAIVEDALDETNETVIVTLSSPSNATLGANTAHTHTITDDDEVFASVVIGPQTWSASNVSLVPTAYDALGIDYWTTYTGSSGHSDDDDGFYYTWDAASKVCPDGWRLPSDADWTTLEVYLGMSEMEATVTNSWNRGTNQGTQLQDGESSGFNAKFAGYDKGVRARGSYAVFWSSTTDEDTGYKFARFLQSTKSTVYRRAYDTGNSFSVRCMKGG